MVNKRGTQSAKGERLGGMEEVGHNQLVVASNDAITSQLAGWQV